MVREEHTPERLSTYGNSHQVHHWVNVGLVVQEDIPHDHYKCSACPQEKFVKKIVRTFP